MPSLFILRTYQVRRSREGARIEMPRNANVGQYISSRSREGARIEMHVTERCVYYDLVAPARERGLKYEAKLHLHNCFIVAPARERGLK